MMDYPPILRNDSAFWLHERHQRLSGRNQRRRGDSLWACMAFALMALVIAIMAFCNSPARGQEIIEFSASWCGPCQEFKPTIHAAEKVGIPIHECDLDSCKSLAANYGVTSIPAMVAVNANGVKVGDVVVGRRSLADIQRLWATVSPVDATIVMQPAATVATQPRTPQQPASVAQPIPAANECPQLRGWPDSRICQRSDGATASFIALHGKPSYAITCQHGITKVGQSLLIFANDGQRIPVVVVGMDQQADCALLKMELVATKFFEVADNEPTIGESYSFYGFPVDMQRQAAAFGGQRGRITESPDPHLGTASGSPTYGHSGGPLIDARGKLFGVLSGNPGGPVIYSRLSEMKKLLVCQCAACQSSGGGCCQTVEYVLPYRNDQAQIWATWRRWADGVNASIKQLQDRAEQTSSTTNAGPTTDDAAWRQQIEGNIARFQSDVDARLRDVSVVKGGGTGDVTQVQLKAACDEWERRLAALRSEYESLTEQMAQIKQTASTSTAKPQPFYMRVSRDSQYQSVSPGQYVTLPLSKQ
jgi:thiol-disulfide isomerase/thioredoxin